MKYDIVKADASIGQIEVCYKDDTGNVLATFAIDVPIIDGKYISGQELDMEIISRGPHWLFERKEVARNASGFEAILNQVKPLNNQSQFSAFDTPVNSPNAIGTTWQPMTKAELDDAQLVARVQQIVSDMNNDSV